jgi:hypothetical protein
VTVIVIIMLIVMLVILMVLVTDVIMTIERGGGTRIAGVSRGNKMP